MRCITSRTTFLGIAMLGMFLAQGVLIGAARAQQRTTLSTVVGRLLKLKKNKPVGQEVEPPSGETAAAQSRPQPQAQPTVRPQAQAAPSQRPRRTSNFTPVARLPQAKRNSLPYPPFPPAVDRAWVHPPVPRPERAYTTEEVLALTRRNGLAASSRRGFQAPVAPDSILEEIDFDPANSPAFAAPGFPVDADPSVNSVRQVNLVTELAEPPIQGLPIQGLPVEAKPIEAKPIEAKPIEAKPIEAKPIDEAPIDEAPIGNRPAEVRELVPAEPGEIEPALSAQPMEIAPIPFGRSSASPTFPPVFQKVRGRIAEIDGRTGMIRIDLLENESLPAGTRIQVNHKTESGDSVAVHLRVLDSVAGVAAGKLIAGATLDSIALGDKTIAWKTDVSQ